MARIKLELPAPEKFIFSTEISPRISDINYGNHLGHDRLFSLLHEVRLRFLASHGFSETDVAGCGTILADLAAVYKKQVNYGDRLKVDLALLDPGRAGCNFFYLASNLGDGREVARATTGIVFFDYREGKICSMPESFAALIPCSLLGK
ncbi:MAG: thioesterase family protein [Deltaproteobacteria bacterium]|nr:thioesterase family protein [Deltaproteobacteria bacterium]